MILSAAGNYKSLRADDVNGLDLPEFTLLTGTNGAGKSNLLEGVRDGVFTFADIGQPSPNQFRMFSLGELLSAAEGPVTGAAFREPWANLANNVLSWSQQAVHSIGQQAHDPDALENWIVAQVLANQMVSQRTLDHMRTSSGHRLQEMTHEDFRRYFPLVAGKRDPFATSIAEVFLSYSERKRQNDTAEFIYEKYQDGDGSHLSREEFVALYGPKPWELLDETLRIVKLPYSFVPPPVSENTNYEVALTDIQGTRIRPADLSTGERVLLAVAMGLFTGTNMTEAIELPRVLLLDEADASLHPSMVASLLTVIQQIFVEQHGVRVLMATHSPSTVALAREESLFVVSKSGKRIRKASTDEALKLLTVGLSSLSVRVENRRQVFVESEYDQEIYQGLFGLMKERLATDRSAEFIAAGKQESGGGCDAVKRLVKDLRQRGVDTVFGIVDRDSRTGGPDNILYIKDRYAVENLLFDPLILGAFLLREKVVTSAELGLAANLRNFDLNSTHAAQVINAISHRVKADSTKFVPTTYAGGFSCDVPKEFLELQGHALEQRIVAEFPQLNSFKTKLKLNIVKRAVADTPDFIPQSLIDVFNCIT